MNEKPANSFKEQLPREGHYSSNSHGALSGQSNMQKKIKQQEQFSKSYKRNPGVYFAPHY